MAAIRISFSNQKGGVGKTTLTCLLASAIHYGYKNFKVAVVDADPQQSFSSTRTTEIDNVQVDEDALSKYLNALQVAEKDSLYDVISAPLNRMDVPALLDSLDSKYDYILVETPGTLSIDGIDELFKSLDYIFIPFCPSEYVIASTSDFLEKVNNDYANEADSNIRACSMVNVMYPLNDNTAEVTAFKKWNDHYKDKFGIHTLENNLKESSYFKNITTPDELIKDAKLLGLDKSDSQKMMNSGMALGDNKTKSKKYVNTLSPFPKTQEFDRISPYPLIKEIIDFINQNI